MSISTATEQTGISVFLKNPNADQQAEDDYFRASELENASADLYKSLLYMGKALSLLTFDDMVRRFGLSFSGRVLELGGGYGYLSAYLKRRWPDVTMVYSDVSAEAVRKSAQYERFFDVALDQKWVTAAEETPFEDESFDTILFFASFHHTQRPQDAVLECARLLRPGGKLVLMMEPSCPGYLKRLYDLHVHRDEVRENYYSVGEYRRFFRTAGLAFEQHDYSGFLYRHSKLSTLYYVLVSAVPGPLKRMFPCSQVIVGQKPIVR